MPRTYIMYVMNGELEIEGKKYISSKRAAEVSGYAKDYIGQLCRMGKIEARLIGRNWYVSEASLRSHERGEDAILSDEPAPEAEDVAAIEKLYDQPIENMVTSESRRRIQERLASDLAVLFYPENARYGSDGDAPLIPQLIPKNPVSLDEPVSIEAEEETVIPITVAAPIAVPSELPKLRRREAVAVSETSVRRPVLGVSLALTLLIVAGGLALSFITVERVAEFQNTAQAGLASQTGEARTYYQLSETSLAKIFK